MQILGTKSHRKQRHMRLTKATHQLWAFSQTEFTLLLNKQLTLTTSYKWGESHLVVELREQVQESISQSLMELVGFHHARKVVDSAGPVLRSKSPEWFREKR